ncbi:hypothetical protein [Waltera sp.]|uniref:hypothetical protein n=1 Tax=Waltera sp. TaxID=2815806 RepID=UPI003AB6B250
MSNNYEQNNQNKYNNSYDESENSKNSQNKQNSQQKNVVRKNVKCFHIAHPKPAEELL